MQLFELRSNPDKNPKQKLDLTKYITGGYYVTFTELPKVGINPQSVWTDTPLGVYSFSLDDQHVQKYVHGNSAFTFGNHSAFRYATVLKYTGNIVKLSSITETDVDSIVDKIHEILTPEQSIMFDEHVNAILMEYHTYPPLEWYKTIRLAAKSYGNFSYRYDQKGRWPAVWNMMFRKLGIDGLTDDEGKIIYHAEPYQTVFFDPTKIKIVERDTNPTYEYVTVGSLRSLQLYMDKFNISKQHMLSEISRIRQGNEVEASTGNTPVYMKFSKITEDMMVYLLSNSDELKLLDIVTNVLYNIRTYPESIKYLQSVLVVAIRKLGYNKTNAEKFMDYYDEYYKSNHIGSMRDSSLLKIIEKILPLL